MNTAIAKPVLKHILIVDDSIDNQNLLKLLLESSGYIVECTRNGQEALSFLRSPHLPDLILTDLQMPVMDGRDFVRHLRENSKFKSIPIVVMTGSEQNKQLVDDHGVAEVLTKPLRVQTIRETIGRVLSKQNSELSLSPPPILIRPLMILLPLRQLNPRPQQVLKLYRS